MTVLKRLWDDENGFIVSSELILLATITVIGMLVGLATWRDSVVQELGDTGAAVGQMNQSYSIEISGPDFSVSGDEVTLTKNYGSNVTVTSTFNNYGYTDEPDFCDQQDVADVPPAGISVLEPPQPEGP